MFYYFIIRCLGGEFSHETNNVNRDNDNKDWSYKFGDGAKINFEVGKGKQDINIEAEELRTKEYHYNHCHNSAHYFTEKNGWSWLSSKLQLLPSQTHVYSELSRHVALVSNVHVNGEKPVNLTKNQVNNSGEFQQNVEELSDSADYIILRQEKPIREQVQSKVWKYFVSFILVK